MAKRNIITGIDVGTHMVRVVICEVPESGGAPRILGSGTAESRGVRHGYIVNIEGTAKSISYAVRRAEQAAGTKVSRAFLSAGGIGLEGRTCVGTALVSQVEGEVENEDVAKACNSAEMSMRDVTNRKILQAIPLSFRLDGKQVLGRPNGLKGVKLEAKVLIVTALSQHIGDLISAADMAEIEVVDVLPSPIAASFVTLSKQQKTAGCVLANIGSETVSIVVFENNIPISLEVFPVGSTDITNDIALGLQVPLEEAEKIKVGNSATGSKQKLEEIIESRLENVFKLIEAHLKKIERNGLLPAGIIITGGGSGLATIEDLAKTSLQLPSSKAELRYRSRKNQEKTNKNIFKDAPSWAVAYGLCVLGNQSGQDESLWSSGKEWLGSARDGVIGLIKRFLP